MKIPGADEGRLSIELDVVAVVDPLVSQISPDHFGEFMEEPFRRIFDFIRERRAKSFLFVCGNATLNPEPMCQTGCDFVSVDENVNLADAKKVCYSYV